MCDQKEHFPFGAKPCRPRKSIPSFAWARRGSRRSISKNNEENIQAMRPCTHTDLSVSTILPSRSRLDKYPPSSRAGEGFPSTSWPDPAWGILGKEDVGRPTVARCASRHCLAGTRARLACSLLPATGTCAHHQGLYRPFPLHESDQTPTLLGEKHPWPPFGRQDSCPCR